MAIPRRHPNFLKCGGVPCNSSPWPSRRRWSSAGPGCLFSRRQGELGCLELHLLHTDLPAHPQTTKAFLPRMLELQNGHIVCLNSVLALSAIPGAIDYCTSKASAFAFMESLTLGLLDCPGVSATTVLPFHTSTEMFQGLRVRFPNLFPPLKPETVARRTVEAVQLNQALLLLPWTMHALIILKRYRAGGESSGSDSCQPSPLSPVDPGGEEAAGRRRYTCDRLVMSVVGVKITSGGMCAVDLLSLLWSSSSQTC